MMPWKIISVKKDIDRRDIPKTEKRRNSRVGRIVNSSVRIKIAEQS